ncbi:Pentatricopeptide repeat-containing protein [Platanthera guangdongensis]|uniref:Pentatricopeptide repeat-containing protein n=1 Tax=Platanthera guangdongensis TaxID=2320717 RepID=A0ABR2MFA1_9ASPA
MHRFVAAARCRARRGYHGRAGPLRSTARFRADSSGSDTLETLVVAATQKCANIGQLLPHPAAAALSPCLHHLLQLCAREDYASSLGKTCHALCILSGLQTHSLLTSNLLINFYAKSGLLDSARKVFDGMPRRSIVSWNTMIACHTRLGQHLESLRLFVRIRRQGLSPSAFTFSTLLCSCAEKAAISECRQLHGFALKTAGDSNVFVGTALLDAYAKCRMIADSRQIFDSLHEKSSVTWSSMVAGCVQNDLHEEALVLASKSHRTGLEWSEFTLSAALSACSSLAAAIDGTQLHCIVVRSGFDWNVFVGAALVDLYAKCGMIDEAYRLFSGTDEKNIVLLNVMIAGFSRHARCVETMILFEKMRQMGIPPNEATYLSVLFACGHGGLVESGRCYLDAMIRRDDGVRPTALHYSCMVDVLGRSGFIPEARELMGSMPFLPTPAMWGSLLGSCRIHGNLRQAEVAAEHLFELEPENAGNHLLLSNLYAAGERWEGVAAERKHLRERGLRREKGRSWLEVRDRVHVFVAGEREHPRISEVYAKLVELRDEMRRELGYEAERGCDVHPVAVEEKEELLWGHSEKLAFAFGLLSLPAGASIRINKNLRVCGDCHSFLKLASLLRDQREIVVRDAKRFHHFLSGSCSCRDFW